MTQEQYDRLHAELDKMQEEMRELIHTDIEKSKEMLSHFLTLLKINRSKLK